MDIDGNNASQIKAIGVAISTFETLPTFKAPEIGRRHVEESIRRSGCDLDLVTDRRGRPYSLVCTKNHASYDRRAQQRQHDLTHLAQREALSG